MMKQIGVFYFILSRGRFFGGWGGSHGPRYAEPGWPLSWSGKLDGIPLRIGFFNMEYGYVRRSMVANTRFGTQPLPPPHLPSLQKNMYFYTSYATLLHFMNF